MVRVRTRSRTDSRQGLCGATDLSERPVQKAANPQPGDETQTVSTTLTQSAGQGSRRLRPKVAAGVDSCFPRDDINLKGCQYLYLLGSKQPRSIPAQQEIGH